MEINLNKIKVGDIFSEESHYQVKEIIPDSIIFKHYESQEKVTLSKSYVKKLLCNADQFEKEVEVTREDKKDGTPGIRTIFENIKSSEVFTVCFTKQETVKTKKCINEEQEKQRKIAIEMIEKAKKNKKSMAEAYKQALEYIQMNPVSSIIPGEERILRGFKKQFVSIDGYYNCIDMDLAAGIKGDDTRKVNIRTIKWLIVNNIKYIVK